MLAYARQGRYYVPPEDAVVSRNHLTSLDLWDLWVRSESTFIINNTSDGVLQVRLKIQGESQDDTAAGPLWSPL
jgi:hypothetical protein